MVDICYCSGTVYLQSDDRIAHVLGKGFDCNDGCEEFQAVDVQVMLPGRPKAPNPDSLGTGSPAC